MKAAFRGKPTNWTEWATVIGTLAAVAGLILAIFLAFRGTGGAANEPAPSLAKVEPVDLVVHNNRFGEPPPRLEILLHNTGNRLAVVSRAKIEIGRVGSLRQCVSQGDLPLSTAYAATLPADATRGDVVEVPLHQQLGADEADRFAITLGIRGDPASSGYVSQGRASLPGPYLFELAISLQSDEGGSPVDVGRALVSLPSTPDAPLFYWDEDSEASLERFDREMERGIESAGDAAASIPPWPTPVTNRCWFSNTRTLRSMLATNAKRSPTLDAVAASIVTPNVSALEGPSR